MNDQRIGAFLDRELDEEARAAQDKDFEEHPGGAMRLRVFKKADDLLRQAVPASAASSDHALSQRILNAEPIGRPTPLRFVQAFAPLAAACVLGVLVGVVASPSPTSPPLRHLNGALQTALDTTPSGETRAIAAGNIAIAMTVRTPSGALCRQFRLSDGREKIDAVACREGAAWRLLTAQSVTPQNGQDYRVAAGDQAPFDGALIALSESILVDEAEERVLIDRDWAIR